MAQQAKYTVFVPQADDLGQSLKDLASHAGNHLKGVPAFRDALVHSHPGQGHTTLMVVAQDIPEVDGHIKQMASYLGEVANSHAISALKEGGKGVKTWTIANRAYRPGEGAHPSAIASSMVSPLPHPDPLVQPDAPEAK